MPKFEIVNGQFVGAKGAAKGPGETIDLSAKEAAAHIRNGDLKPPVSKKSVEEDETEADDPTE
jgi:hypothetical protein